MATLYAIDSATNIVYRIDSLKGTARQVGQLGLQSNFSGLASDISEPSDQENLFTSNLFDSLNRQDFIQLQGSADDYRLDFFTSELGTIDADLVFDPGVTARGEVIATLQDVSTELSVTKPSFVFV